ncbi:MAG: hypothetical protein ACJ8EL_14735, partial [Rhizomicrobium sp.]
ECRGAGELSMGRKRKPPVRPAQNTLRGLPDDLRKVAELPLWRELKKSERYAEVKQQLRKASKSPAMLEVRERLRQLQRELDDEDQPQKKRRGGRPRSLTEKQIERGTRIAKMKKHRHLQNKQLYDLLRRELKLPNDFRDLNLWRLIVSRTPRA